MDKLAERWTPDGAGLSPPGDPLLRVGAGRILGAVPLGGLTGRSGSVVRRHGALIGAENRYFDAAVLRARLAVARFIDRLHLSEADHVNAINRDVVLGYEVLDDGIGAAPAESLVVIGAPDLIRESFDRDEIALVLVSTGYHLIELLLAIAGELVTAELEQDGSRAHRLIVIEIGDLAPQISQIVSDLLGLLVGLVGARHSLTGFGINGHDALIGCAQISLGFLNLLFGLIEVLIRLVNLLTVLIGLLRDLIQLAAYGGDGITDVFLRRAAPT
jgi:hypothetical protein